MSSVLLYQREPQSDSESADDQANRLEPTSQAWAEDFTVANTQRLHNMAATLQFTEASLTLTAYFTLCRKRLRK